MINYEKIGNIILGALIMLVGLVILTESNDNHIDIKIADKENLSVDNVKNVIFISIWLSLLSVKITSPTNMIRAPSIIFPIFLIVNHPPLIS